MNGPALPREFASGRHALNRTAHTTKFLGRQYEGGKLTHYRGWQSDLRAVKERAQKATEATADRKTEYKYAGSIDRAVMHDWLMKQGKSWHDIAVDKDLKAKFMAWYRSEYSLLMADAYRERPLSVNRTTMTRPKLGATILHSYQKEMSA